MHMSSPVGYVWFIVSIIGVLSWLQIVNGQQISCINSTTETAFYDYNDGKLPYDEVATVCQNFSTELSDNVSIIQQCLAEIWITGNLFAMVSCNATGCRYIIYGENDFAEKECGNCSNDIYPFVCERKKVKDDDLTTLFEDTSKTSTHSSTIATIQSTQHQPTGDNQHTVTDSTTIATTKSMQHQPAGDNEHIVTVPVIVGIAVGVVCVLAVAIAVLIHMIGKSRRTPNTVTNKSYGFYSIFTKHKRKTGEQDTADEQPHVYSEIGPCESRNSQQKLAAYDSIFVPKDEQQEIGSGCDDVLEVKTSTSDQAHLNGIDDNMGNMLKHETPIYSLARST